MRESGIKGAGTGLFSRTMFRKGDTVCEYAGRKVFKVHNMELYVNDRDFYLSEIHPYARNLSDDTVIVGDREIPNSGVFVNDGARLTSKSSADIQRYVQESERRANVTTEVRGDQIFYVATKRIKKGEEILASYGVHYWLLLHGIPAEELRDIQV